VLRQGGNGVLASHLFTQHSTSQHAGQVTFRSASIPLSYSHAQAQLRHTP
jgi:hypothetical protein